MESTAQASADADENMRLAVERFRIKMEASNRQFLQDRIHEIEDMNLSTEEAKLDKMSVYWLNLTVRPPQSPQSPKPTRPIMGAQSGPIGTKQYKYANSSQLHK
ncbi:hypothetical protein N7449_011735 [Penicillium cf. viridicatum]|uniref:Uncharacterized protein n=1 Tax=Penicillium cf. viridicatum TaxID=2972119 RepID=A0A9W9IM24_9EURO|nr:hypothetical protein N7449_011735 [Penicillium cf. viridicatum]